MCRMEKFVMRASEQALSSDYMYQLGALVFKGGKILAVGNNKANVHAEVDALNQLKPHQTKGADLVVVRISKTGLAMSKPCPICQIVIRNRGIKRVFYTTRNGMNTMKF